MKKKRPKKKVSEFERGLQYGRHEMVAIFDEFIFENWKHAETERIAAEEELKKWFQRDKYNTYLNLIKYQAVAFSLKKLNGNLAAIATKFQVGGFRNLYNENNKTKKRS